MSRASITSKRSRRLSKEGSTHGAPAQSAHLDEQPLQQNDTVRPADDEEENCRPLVVTSPGISNSGPPQPPEPHVQESTSTDSPKGTSAAEARKVVLLEDQPSPNEIVDVMKRVLEVFKDSMIPSKSGQDNRSRFWGLYKRVAEEHDNEFLERHNSDMDIVLVFSGLFSAVSTSFIVAMEPNFSPDPNDTTHALLTQLVQIGLGNFTAAGSTPASPASTWSPSTATIWIQTIAYASLSFSLLTAFGAVLGKQWLRCYKSQRYGRGSLEERGKCRQEKFDGIVTWHFDAVLQCFLVLLQISLLLFGIALGANMWFQQHTIAWVIIATTVFGFLFHSLTVMVALVSPTCPFRTPISAVLRMLHVDKVLCPMVILAYPYLKQLVTLVHGVLQWGLDVLYDQYDTCRTRLSGLADSVFAACSFAWYYLQSLFGTFQCLLPSRSPTSVVDSEAQLPDQNLHAVATNQYLKLKLPDTPTSSLEASSIKWLLETSTDIEAIHCAASLIPHVDWPLDLDVSDMLRSLYDVYISCLDFQEEVIPSLEEKASACTMALCHLYHHHILQGHFDYGFFGKGSTDYDVFRQMWNRTKVKDNVLVATIQLSYAKYGPIQPSYAKYGPIQLSYAKYGPTRWSSPLKFGACPDSVLKWLSHTLPFHFVIGQVDEDVEKLAITVISKFLSCLSSLSPQIIANCTLLACVMVGVQFDEKDIIVRVDKSSALPQLAESLLAQFRKVLWASDGESTVRRAWDLTDVICRVVELGLPHPRPGGTWMLDVCRKIYSRARSSERHQLAALRKVQRFRFDSNSQWDPAHPSWLWQAHLSWQGNSHLPEDFDWLVDYLSDVCSNDHETAGNILVLLGSMTVSCSPAKQHLFMETLIACMGGSMPRRLRHAALRAAHSSREVLASIDIVDDADMVLTNLSHAILTAVCPQQSTIFIDDGPDRFFDPDRDLCYLELIFALARNSYWRPHLNSQIDRTIGMITMCCKESRELHAFYLTGIFLRMTSEQMSAIPLSSITEQQWWDMMRKAWCSAHLRVDDTRCIEFLPVLVEGTKKYMCIASKADFEQLIRNVDLLIWVTERQGELEQREGVVAVKELRDVANDILAKFSK